MRSKLVIFFLLIFCVITVKAQVSTATYNTLYQTENQPLWQPGSTGVFEVNQELFGFDWDNGGTFGDITTIAGQSFGAEVTAGTWGEMGSGLTINFGSERVDINYNADMEIDYPSISSFQAGDEIILNTDWQPINSGSSILPDSYDMNIGLWLRMGMGIDLSAELCAFGCDDYDFIDLNMNTMQIDLVELSSANGLSLLNDLVNIPPSGDYPLNFFPIIYSDPTGIITLNLDMPHNTGGASSSHLNNDILKYNSTFHYFNMHLSIPKMIGALNIPYVSAVFGNLSNSWTTGPFYLNYTIMDAGFDLGLYNNQRLSFEPEMHGKLDFPALVDYRVINPSNGAVLETGLDSVINYQPGQEIRIDFPCEYDFMDVTPSYHMENEFTNHTYDSIAFDFVFDMLSFNVGVQALTVIPEICIPIYKPCGPWYCPVCDWCHDGDLCTPAVTFNGYNAGFGPLVHWQPNLYNTSYNWVNDSWEMQGFNEFENLAPIRIEPAKFSVSTTHVDVLCHGDNTGEATAFVVNGKPPYTYEWSNGESSFSHQTSASISNLSAGTHYVEVTDNNGCIVFASFIVEEPNAPLSAQAELTNPLCNGEANGEITMTVSGGTPDYTYQWSNGETTQNISDLIAGTYTLTITDDNLCSFTASYTLTEPDALALDLITNDVSCNGGNSGSIETQVSGGVTPYTYAWSNGELTASLNDVSAGTYSVTVTDENGCTISASTEINEPAEPLNIVVNTENVLCNGGATGNIYVTVTGGTEPYNFMWYDNEGSWLNYNGNALENIVAGDYMVQVTDANDCVETENMTIQEPEAFDYTLDITNVLCYGESTGAIDVSPTGGTLPYTYLWSNGMSDEDISDVPAGEYSLTITDANACEYIIEAEIEQPDNPLVSTVSTESVACYGDETGSVSVSTSGGTPPYSYLWSTDATEQSLSGLAAGIYSVTITDSHGCENYTGGEVRQPDAPLSLTSSTLDVSCFGGDDGFIKLDINGGTLPYRIQWDDNEYLINNALFELTSLVTGEYNISILDANNCKLNDSFFIDQPNDVEITITSEMVSCFEGSDGYAIAEVNGGTTPYAYMWSNGQNQAELINVSAGNYQLTVSDAQDCEYQSEVEIDSWPEIIVDYTITEMTCRDVDDAAIDVTVSGGTDEFIFVWSNGAVTEDISELPAGDYSLTITDGNQCEEFIDVYIEQSTNECLNIPSSFTPNGDGYNDTWVLRNIDAYPEAHVQVYEQTGRMVFESTGSYQAWDGKFNGNQVPATVYYYIIDLKDGSEVKTGSLTILR